MSLQIYLSLLIFSPVFFSSALNFSGKSYYFKTNGNNEFRVYNRIHFLNHNISDYDANPHTPFRPQSIKVNKIVNNNLVNKESHKNTIPTNLYLDEEWNYDHKPNNKTNLPFFIKKMYENRNKNPNKTNTVRILFNTNSNSSSRIIKFNLGSLKSNENVSDADMYFYWPLENSSSIYKSSVVLRLYQFEKQFNNDLNESNLIENPDIHKLFNVIYISKAQKGWQTFKLKKPIDNWSKGEENLGLLLTISSYDDNKLISIYNDTNKGVFRTFTVMNIQKNETIVHLTSNTTTPKDTDPSDNSTSSSFSHMCSRKPWQVDFKQLQWNKFILYPENGYTAYHCAGKCHFEENTKNQHMNNYAIMRQLNNGQHGFREKVCCVPTKFKSLPIMFFDRYDNIILKNYDDMVVDECGCR